MPTAVVSQQAKALGRVGGTRYQGTSTMSEVPTDGITSTVIHYTQLWYQAPMVHVFFTKHSWQ